MPIFFIPGLIGLVLIIMFIIFFTIACISVERTKNESIRMRELLENINKIQIAFYKKEFGVDVEKKDNQNTVDLSTVPSPTQKIRA